MVGIFAVVLEVEAFAQGKQAASRRRSSARPALCVVVMQTEAWHALQPIPQLQMKSHTVGAESRRSAQQWGAGIRHQVYQSPAAWSFATRHRHVS